MQNNNNNIIDNGELLFFKVWRNIYILKNIFKYVGLFYKNKVVTFNSKKQLLEYPEKEFIEKLNYHGYELLEIGDLDTTLEGVLKEIEFYTFTHTSMNGNVLPFGIEIIKFPWAGNNFRIPKTRLSTYPSSVHTIENVFLGKETTSDEEEKEKEEGDTNCSIIVPSNIKKLFACVAPNVSGIDKGKGYIVLQENAIQDIGFDCYWDNDGVILRKGDFPEGITNLAMYGYEVKNLSVGILPSTIKELSLSYGCDADLYNFIIDQKIKGGNHEQDLERKDNLNPGYFDVIPINCEKLSISCYTSITVESKLNQCLSILDLTISRGDKTIEIEPNSLPPNLKNLTIDYFQILNDIGIPKSVEKLILNFPYGHGIDYNPTEFIKLPPNLLSLSSNYFFNPSDLPSSLTHLDYSGYIIDEEEPTAHEIEQIKMPKEIKSLKSIILHKSLWSIEYIDYPIEVGNIISYSKK